MKISTANRNGTFNPAHLKVMFKKLTPGQWIKLGSLALALADSVLAYGDRIKTLPLPGWAVSAWPFVLILAGVVHKAGSILFPDAAVVPPAGSAPAVIRPSADGL